MFLWRSTLFFSSFMSPEWNGHVVLGLPMLISFYRGLFMKNDHRGLTFVMVISVLRDGDFIVGVHTSLMKPFQMTLRSMSV